MNYEEIYKELDRLFSHRDWLNRPGYLELADVYGFKDDVRTQDEAAESQIDRMLEMLTSEQRQQYFARR